MRIFISENASSLASNAAAWITDRIRYVLSVKDKCTLVLSGGSTPEKLYDLLAADPYKNSVDWSRVIFFWGDERYVPIDDPLSNAKMAIEHLLDQLPVRPVQIHIIPTAPDPETAAKAYADTIIGFFRKEKPVFDLVLLGLGDNAHTLSLFPGYPVVHEEKKTVDSFYLKEQQQSRITLTAPIVNDAAAVVFLVSGANKATAMQQVFMGPANADLYPAQRIKPVNGKLFVFTDTAAASLL